MPIRDHPTRRVQARSMDDRDHASSDAWWVAQATRGGVRPVRNRHPSPSTMDRRVRRLLADVEPTSRRLPRGRPVDCLCTRRPARARERWRGRCDRVVLGRPGHHPAGCTASTSGAPPGAELPGTDEPAGRWLAGSPEVRARSRGRVIDPTRNRLDRTPGVTGSTRAHPSGATRRTPAILVDRWRRLSLLARLDDGRPVPGPSCVVIPHGLREFPIDRSTAGESVWSGAYAESAS